MRRFIAARLAQAAIVVALVTTIAFLLLRIAPGDPFSYENPSVSPEVRERWRVAFGYDRPLPVQFARYVGSLLKGDLGYSHVAQRPVRDVIANVLPRTLTLAAVSLALGIVFGISVGTFSAVAHRTRWDRAIAVISVFIFSIPDFWLALLVQMSLGAGLGIFPISGITDPLIAEYGSFGMVLRDRLSHIAMPALTLTLLISAVLARYQRASLIDILPDDFLRTARAKGATEKVVVLRHGLRNALTPTITMLGLIVPSVLGGVFFIEYVFDWRGLGWTTVTAVGTLDYDVVTASVIISGTLVALSSCAADILAAIADPRIRDA